MYTSFELQRVCEVLTLVYICLSNQSKYFRKCNPMLKTQAWIVCGNMASRFIDLLANLRAKVERWRSSDGFGRMLHLSVAGWGTRSGIRGYFLESLPTTQVFLQNMMKINFFDSFVYLQRLETLLSLNVVIRYGVSMILTISNSGNGWKSQIKSKNLIYDIISL